MVPRAGGAETGWWDANVLWEDSIGSEIGDRGSGVANGNGPFTIVRPLLVGDGGGSPARRRGAVGGGGR
jgi:hypothetical protein